MMQHTLEERALNAYQRARFHDLRFPYLDPLAPGAARVVELEGLSYVILSRDARVVAVYRILQSGGLKRLKRWPQGIAA